MDVPERDDPTPCERDRHLVGAALNGEPAAVDELLERLLCVPRILSAKNAQAGSPLTDHELEDLTQDTLLAIWKKLSGFNGSARLETWVFRFCFLELLKRLRDRRRGRLRTSPVEAADVAVFESPGILEHQDIHAGLERLDPDEAEAIRLKHFENLTFREAGRRLRESENTIKGRYYRGIRKLRALLGERTLQRDVRRAR